MKVLHIVAGMSSNERPYHQPFIKSQIDSLKKNGVECDVYEIKSYDSKLEYFKSVQSIRKLLRDKNYDVMHTHYSYCGLVAHYACSRVPIVLSLMGSDVLGTPNYGGKLTLRGKIDRMISKFTVDKVNHIIVKSKRMRDYLKCKVPVSIIPNGIDLNIFKPMDTLDARRNLGFRPEDFLVLFLGNKNEPVKNFKLAKRSFESFKKQNNFINIKFLNPFGISHHKVVEYMNASDVLLLTSFWEGSPNVIKEAMACNLPIISTNVGDVKEIMSDAIYCFSVNFSEVEIVENLNRIFQKRQRSNGRSKINNLSSDVISRRIIELYKNVIHNKL